MDNAIWLIMELNYCTTTSSMIMLSFRCIIPGVIMLMRMEDVMLLLPQAILNWMLVILKILLLD
jgi:hypothetical protein